MNIGVIEERVGNLITVDIYSKMVENRVIFINEDVDDYMAGQIIAQLLYLDSLNNEEISVYVNTNGGRISSGLAIYDVSKLIKSPIKTVALGMAASMGAILLLMGDTRCALKHTRIMLHQPSGGAVGTLQEIKITHEVIEDYKNDLYKIILEKTKIKNPEELFKFDTWYSSQKALDEGIITKIL